MAGIPFINSARKIPRSKGEVAKDVAIKEGEKIAIGIVGFVPIAIAVVIAVIFLLIISVVSVLGHSSEDPNFAQQVGLDSVFNNSPNSSSSGDGGNTGGQCTATGELPSVPSCSVSSSSSIDSALLSNFGLTLVGNSADCEAKEAAFSTYSELFQSSKYASLVKNAQGTKITMTDDACGGR